MGLLSRSTITALTLSGLSLAGCVSAVPTQPTLTVIPGQGKTETNLRADDASCRVNPTGAASPATVVARTQAGGTAPAVTSEQYYACMAAHGETVIEQQTEVVPAYAGGYPGPYAYPAYDYPYYGYPYGYGYPFYGPYFGPYVGFGVGFGFGRFYGGRGFYGGYHGGYGYHGYGYGGYHGGYGGFHGGGFGGRR